MDLKNKLSKFLIDNHKETNINLKDYILNKNYTKLELENSIIELEYLLNNRDIDIDIDIDKINNEILLIQEIIENNDNKNNLFNILLPIIVCLIVFLIIFNILL